jgi:hypothetical protein
VEDEEEEGPGDERPNRLSIPGPDFPSEGIGLSEMVTPAMSSTQANWLYSLDASYGALGDVLRAREAVVLARDACWREANGLDGKGVGVDPISVCEPNGGLNAADPQGKRSWRSACPEGTGADQGLEDAWVVYRAAAEVYNGALLDVNSEFQAMFIADPAAADAVMASTTLIEADVNAALSHIQMGALLGTTTTFTYDTLGLELDQHQGKTLRGLWDTYYFNEASTDHAAFWGDLLMRNL